MPKLLDHDALALFEEILTQGTALRVRVTGRSMAPFVCGGDIVTIKQTDCLSLHIGDLMFFKNGQDLPMLHRIIRKKRTPGGMLIFQTKGDALMAPDEPVEPYQVLGKVCLIEKTNSVGRLSSKNMESGKYRIMNYGIALLGVAKWQIRHVLHTLKKALLSS